MLCAVKAKYVYVHMYTYIVLYMYFHIFEYMYVDTHTHTQESLEQITRKRKWLDTHQTVNSDYLYVIGTVDNYCFLIYSLDIF